MSDDPIMDEAAQVMRRISEEERGSMSRDERLELTRRPETAPLKHGAYVRGIVVCWERCPMALAGRCDQHTTGQDCPHEQARYDGMYVLLHELVERDGLMDPRLAVTLIGSAIQRLLWYERLLAYAAVMEAVHPDDMAEGRFLVQSGHAAIEAAEKRWDRALDQLLLSPTARLELESTLQDTRTGAVAAQIVALDRQATVVDTEFEAAADGDGARAGVPVPRDGEGATAPAPSEPGGWAWSAEGEIDP